MDVNQLLILDDWLKLANRIKWPYSFPKELQDEIDSIRKKISNSTNPSSLSWLDIEVANLVSKIMVESSRLLEQYRDDSTADWAWLWCL